MRLIIHQIQYEIVINENRQSECEIEQYATRFEYMQHMKICHKGERKLCDETCNAAIKSKPPKRKATRAKSPSGIQYIWNNPKMTESWRKLQVICVNDNVIRATKWGLRKNF